MLIRFAIFLSILIIVISGGLFLLTGEARYRDFAWQVARFILYVLLVFGVLYLLERFGLAVWLI